MRFIWYSVVHWVMCGFLYTACFFAFWGPLFALVYIFAAGPDRVDPLEAARRTLEYSAKDLIAGSVIVGGGLWDRYVGSRLGTLNLAMIAVSSLGVSILYSQLYFVPYALLSPRSFDGLSVQQYLDISGSIFILAFISFWVGLIVVRTMAWLMGGLSLLDRFFFTRDEIQRHLTKGL